MTHIARWATWLTTVAGAPGLFVVAFLDSSFLSLPEINDLLIIWMVTQHKERMLYYVAMSTAGSLAGCFIVYLAGLKGGEAVLRRRFGHGRVERGMRTFQRYGLFALLIPAVLPPPAPFKIFVLLAGVARVGVGTFALAIGIGRGTRYLAEGILAVWYGDIAIKYMTENAKPVGLVVGGVMLLAVIAWVVRARLRRK